MSTPTIQSADRHAALLLDLLVDEGPLTSAEICARLGWTRGRFAGALRRARDTLGPELGLALPCPTPLGQWRYTVTDEWGPVQDGAMFTLGQIESRFRGLLRDVRIVKPNLEPGSREWRRANFLEKHLNHIMGTLEDIDGG